MSLSVSVVGSGIQDFRFPASEVLAAEHRVVLSLRYSLRFRIVALENAQADRLMPIKGLEVWARRYGCSTYLHGVEWFCLCRA